MLCTLCASGAALVKQPTPSSLPPKPLIAHHPNRVEFLCHDISWHVPHHCSTKIPWYNLRKATNSLRANWGDYMTECTFNWRMMKVRRRPPPPPPLFAPSQMAFASRRRARAPRSFRRRACCRAPLSTPFPSLTHSLSSSQTLLQITPSLQNPLPTTPNTQRQQTIFTELHVFDPVTNYKPFDYKGEEPLFALQRKVIPNAM